MVCVILLPSLSNLKFLYSPDVAIARKLCSELLIVIAELSISDNGFCMPIFQGLPCLFPLIIISPPISIK